MHVDIDECTENTDGCAQMCTNTIGNYICACGSGYRLANDSRGCDGEFLMRHRDGTRYTYNIVTVK